MASSANGHDREILIEKTPIEASISSAARQISYSQKLQVVDPRLGAQQGSSLYVGCPFCLVRHGVVDRLTDVGVLSWNTDLWGFRSPSITQTLPT